MTKSRPTNPADALAKRINDLENKVTALSQRGLWVPIVDADPDAGAQGYGNVWAFTDGRLRWRGPDGVVHQINADTDTGGTSATPAPAPVNTAPQTYQSTWDASWSASFGDHGLHSSSNLYWGYGDSYNGLNATGLGLPYAAIATALANSTVTQVELYLTCLHTWWSAGATVYFCGGTATSQPSTKAGLGIITGLYNGQNAVAGSSNWYQLNTAFGNELRDGTIHNICLQGKNTNAQYYGYMGGLAAGYNIKLRVSYTR